MPALLDSLARFVQDPPPEFVFELSAKSVLMAHRSQLGRIESRPLPTGTISPSPVRDNIALTEPIEEAIRDMAPSNSRGKSRKAAVLLPDYSAHISVLDFDKFPEKAEEQRSLVGFRIRRSVPFDVEGAALSYFIQDVSSKGPRSVIVAVTPSEVVSRYEAPFRSAGFLPGFVTLAPLACLDLVDNPGNVVIARLSGNIVSLLILQNLKLKLARSIEMTSASLDEVIPNLHQTVVFIEDNLGGAASEILLAGFGTLQEDALRILPGEFSIPIRVLGGDDTGIRGYLKGVTA